ncbi:hypothetical protein BD410DRAFT_804951 [Rickenella mellea]|uniref:MFS general substrate transporter n=1 Tax=Rickenella mellea TaxID=50990 RepID=A0A4Y7PZ09_9AGAM|nr:hypothetical protein BD410DRAFT_804951 [Rickenella mellea]
MALANVLYGLAYRAKVQGVGFTFSMYTKRYCSDTRIVGIRRHTTLAGYLVLGQGIGMSAGPFFGGLLYKVGFKNSVFNGYLAPGWIMADVWIAFWIAATILFDDVPDSPRHEAIEWPSINIMTPAVDDQSKQPEESSSRPESPTLQSPTSAPLPSTEHESFRTTPKQHGHVVNVHYAGLFICWFLVALGFNLATTCTLSLLSKQLPPSWNARTSLAILYSKFIGRVTGSMWGGSGVHVGIRNCIGLEIAFVGIGGLLFTTLWRELKAKTG